VRGSFTVNFNRTIQIEVKGQEPVSREDRHWSFSFQPSSEKEGAEILETYLTQNPALKEEGKTTLTLKRSIVPEQTDTQDTNRFPPYVSDLSGEPFLVHSETHLQEPAAMLGLLFCFGMLSRYHPDVWIGAMEKSVRLTELCDSLFSVCYRKFPQLLLDQLTGEHHFIHAVVSR
jgi:hypothetical protein